MFKIITIMAYISLNKDTKLLEDAFKAHFQAHFQAQKEIFKLYYIQI